MFDRFVVLQDGLTVPAPAYCLALDLEARGFTLHREGEFTLIVRPAARLSAADCEAIRHWKSHLLLLLEYSRRTGLDAHLFPADDTGASSSETAVN